MSPRDPVRDEIQHRSGLFVKFLLVGRSILSIFPPLPPLFILSFVLLLSRLSRLDMSGYLLQWNQKEKNLMAVESGDAFIDVGASRGEWSIWASLKVGESGKVLAIEPNPLAYALLARNTKKMTNVVRVAAAAHSSNGTIEIWTVNNSMSSTENREVISRFMPLMSRGCLVTVRAVTLDSLQSYLDPSQRIVLKIDVEGAEMDVLMGATGILPRVSMAIVEVHSNRLQHLVEDFLNGYGFETEFSEREVFARRTNPYWLIPK